MFERNPAAVCPPDSWPDDATLQAIATENNLSETAFFSTTGAADGAFRLLAPYWAGRLGKKTIYARQVPTRGGELFCQDLGERVLIAGYAVKTMEGVITLP